MNDDPAPAEQAHDTTVNAGTQALPTLSRGKQALYGGILVVGLAAIIWMCYRALVPADCGCTRDRKSAPVAQPGGPLVADFRVAVLAYPGRPGAIDAIQAHSASLRSADYAFLTLSQVAEAVRSGGRLPQRAVAISLDADRKEVVDDLLVFVRMARVPVSLVVRPHMIGKPGSVGWDLVPELQSYGAELHAAADASRGQAALSRDVRSFAKRMHPSQSHLVWDADDADRGRRGTARATPAGVRTLWRSGTKPVAPLGDGDPSAADRPMARALTLERIHIPVTLDAGSVVSKVNALTGQPDPEKAAAQHAGASPIRSGAMSKSRQQDKDAGTTK